MELLALEINTTVTIDCYTVNSKLNQSPFKPFSLLRLNLTICKATHELL